MVEQLLPVEKWGSRFVTFPCYKYVWRVRNYYRVLAAFANTTVRAATLVSANISTMTLSLLNEVAVDSVPATDGLQVVAFLKTPGEWKEFALPCREYRLITSDKPVQVTLFTAADHSDKGSQSGPDACMSVLVPQELWSTGASFRAATGYTRYLHLITEAANANRLKVNGTVANGQWESVLGAPDLLALSMALQNAVTYSLTTDDNGVPFCAYTTGESTWEKYCMPVNMDDKRNITENFNFSYMSTRTTTITSSVNSVTTTSQEETTPNSLSTNHSSIASTTVLKTIQATGTTELNGELVASETPQRSDISLTTVTQITSQNPCTCRETAAEEAQSSTTNMTKEQLSYLVKDIQISLKVNAKKTSAYHRTLTSADDPRTSSKAIGIVGIGVISAFIGCIVLLDLPLLVKHISNLFSCK